MTTTPAHGLRLQLANPAIAHPEEAVVAGPSDTQIDVRSDVATVLFELTGTQFLLDQPEGNGDGPARG
jgi:hypothetical protein